MNARCVKDLMIPLSEYAVVPETATVAEALHLLKEAQSRAGERRQLPPRAVLVVDASRNVVGQMGHLDILKTLEPKYHLLGDLNTLSRAGVSHEIVGALADNLRFWEGDLADVCGRVTHVRVTDVMRPIDESIDENASLSEAVHRVVMWQAMRVLVTRGNDVIGVLRLADLVAEVAEHVSRQ